jgi:hypothetical protein
MMPFSLPCSSGIRLFPSIADIRRVSHEANDIRGAIGVHGTCAEIMNQVMASAERLIIPAHEGDACCEDNSYLAAFGTAADRAYKILTEAERGINIDCPNYRFGKKQTTGAGEPVEVCPLGAGKADTAYQAPFGTQDVVMIQGGFGSHEHA